MASHFGFFNLKKEFEDGRTSVESANQDVIESQNPFYRPKLGLKKFAKTMADSMPNEQKQHLPSCLTKEKV